MSEKVLFDILYKFYYEDFNEDWRPSIEYIKILSKILNDPKKIEEILEIINEDKTKTKENENQDSTLQEKNLNIASKTEKKDDAENENKELNKIKEESKEQDKEKDDTKSGK